ncbi:protease HtpX [Abditibacteriota bacterium]|nr:protease HtpX [Abditibacteriota bacterium]
MFSSARPGQTASGHVTLPYLSHEAFVAPADKIALQNLQKMPVLPLLMRKFNEVSMDQFWYVQNTANSVRCGPKQFHTIYDMMCEACEILSVPEPELYVSYSPEYNAYTAGMNRTFIVLHSALINDFSDDELRFIIGHEVGHIKCGHLLYQSMSQLLLPLLETLGTATLGMGQLVGAGLLAGFLEWVRQAEFSCDRAGLLVCQNPDVALSATMKLGCGNTRFSEEMSTSAFLEQARSYSEQNQGLEGLARAFLFMLYNRYLTHPQVVFRAKGLDEWVKSGAYHRILRGDYPRDAAGESQMGAQKQCTGCGKIVSATIAFCPSCGQKMHPTATALCARCGDPIPPGIKFCLGCGYPTS